MGGSSGGGGLSPQIMAQLQNMLKATKAPVSSIPRSLLALGTVPSMQKQSAFGLAQDAKTSIIRRQGYDDTVATDPTFGKVGSRRGKPVIGVTGHGALGDPGFGSSISKPVLTGHTA